MILNIEIMIYKLKLYLIFLIESGWDLNDNHYFHKACLIKVTYNFIRPLSILNEPIHLKYKNYIINDLHVSFVRGYLKCVKDMSNYIHICFEINYILSKYNDWKILEKCVKLI